MKDLIARSQLLNDKLLQVTNQDSFAVTIEAWVPLEEDLEMHKKSLCKLVDTFQVFQDETVIEDGIDILEDIDIDPLLSGLDQLKKKFSEDMDHVMQGQLVVRVCNNLNSCKNKLEARLGNVWGAYVNSARSSIKGLDAFLELKEEIPDLELPEHRNVIDNLALLQQRSSKLPLGNTSECISEISAFCTAVSAVVEGFGEKYQKRAEAILATANDLNDLLIIEDESDKKCIESVLSQAKTKFKSFEDVDSLGDLVRDVVLLEPNLQNVWSTYVQNLHKDIQYIQNFTKSKEDKDLLGSINLEQNRLQSLSTVRCDSESINKVNKLNKSIKNQIKVLVDRTGLSEAPDNVFEFIKKLYKEGATLEDLQGGVFEWLEEQGLLKHFKLK